MLLLDIVTYFIAAACAGWIAILCVALWRVLHLPVFEEQDAQPLEHWPRVSVIVAACNEEDGLEPALRSLQAQDYPNLEIVIVNDRSTDATGAIIDRLANGDERVTPIHIKELPSGWLGKLNAMRTATEAAQGEWLLYTDADVRFAPDALRRVLALAEGGEYDHVSLVPEIETNSFLQEVCTQTFATGLLLAVPVHRVPYTDEKTSFGVGAFNLVRREAYERTEGLDWIRMEIADDLGLAILLKRHGARAWAGIAPETLQLQWYPSTAAMIRGGEKNMFPIIGGMSWIRAVATVGGLTAFAAIPVVALVLPTMLGWGAGLAVWLLLAAYALVGWRAQGTNPVAMLFLPVGLVVLAYSLLRSTLSFRANGGAVWRGTTYPLEELRENQRVRF